MSRLKPFETPRDWDRPHDQEEAARLAREEREKLRQERDAAMRGVRLVSVDDLMPKRAPPPVPPPVPKPLPPPPPRKRQPVKPPKTERPSPPQPPEPVVAPAAPVAPAPEPIAPLPPAKEVPPEAPPVEVPKSEVAAKTGRALADLLRTHAAALMAIAALLDP